MLFYVFFTIGRYKKIFHFKVGVKTLLSCVDTSLFMCEKSLSRIYLSVSFQKFGIGTLKVSTQMEKANGRLQSIWKV